MHISVNSNTPSRVLKAVLSRSSLSTSTCQCPLMMSNVPKPCSVDVEQMTLLCFFVLSVCCNSHHVTACDPRVLTAFPPTFHLPVYSWVTLEVYHKISSDPTWDWQWPFETDSIQRRLIYSCIIVALFVYYYWCLQHQVNNLGSHVECVEDVTTYNYCDWYKFKYFCKVLEFIPFRKSLVWTKIFARNVVHVTLIWRGGGFNTRSAFLYSPPNLIE